LLKNVHIQKSLLQSVISDQKALKWESSAIDREQVSIMEDDSIVVDENRLTV